MLLVLLMLLLALAAGLGLALPAAAQATPAGSPSLNVACDPAEIPAGVDVLVQCKIVARNGGATTLAGARIAFTPPTAAVPLPDRYYFFSTQVDGAERDTNGGGTTVYDIGDIAPGGERVIAARVIVRSARHFGADVALVAGLGQEEYARQPVTIGVDATAPPVDVRLLDEGRVSSTGAISLGLQIHNRSQDPIKSADVEFLPGGRFTVAGGRIPLAAAPGAPESAPRYTVRLGSVAPGQISEQPLSLRSTLSPCDPAQPAVLVTAHLAGGSMLHLAAIAGLVPPCATGSGSSAALPPTGAGPSPGPPPHTPARRPPRRHRRPDPRHGHHLPPMTH